MTAQRPKVLHVGASGVIGRAVAAAMRDRFEVITAGPEDAQVALDITQPDTMLAAFGETGPVHHVVCTAGRAHFVALGAVSAAPATASRYWLGLEDKLMGQVNLALVARQFLEPGGSVVLTSGTTSDEPILGGSSLSMANGALEKWVQAAATEYPPGLRLNVVSPGFVQESPPPAHAAFAGFEALPAETVARGYLRCLLSGITGQTVRIG